MTKIKASDLTKYEKARIIGARALQLAMGAPPLVKVPEEFVNTVSIAEMEFEKRAIPLQVIRE